MALIVCPTCGTQYRVADSQLSKASKLRCQKCNMVFQPQDSVQESSVSESPPSVSESLETSQYEISPEEQHTLDFPASEESQPESQQETDTLEVRKSSVFDIDLGDMNLGGAGSSDKSSAFESETKSSLFDLDLSFDPSSPEVESSPADLDFSFSASIPEEAEPGDEVEIDEKTESDEEVEIRDHIGRGKEDTQEKIEIGLDDVPLEDTAVRDRETTLSMEQGLDFSFSASIPDLEEVEGAEEGEKGISEESGEFAEVGGQEISPEAGDFGETLVTETGISPDSQPVEEPPAVDEQVRDEEPLSTCCIDSLAMGLAQCELCGRNLEGKESLVAEELEQQRKEQLREALYEGEVQVGFSEEQIRDESTIGPQEEEDFSDVEQALDALADGSFEKTVKKREAKKYAAEKMKMIGAGIGVVLLLVVGVFWIMRPPPHKKLLARYNQLASQQEIDPADVTMLFLDAVSEQDRDIFSRVSVMTTMPDITSGSIMSVGEEYDEISLGTLGKDLQTVQEEIATTEKKIEEKTKLLQEYSGKDLSPRIIEEKINTLTKKRAETQAEFDEKEAESAKKLVRLQQELADTKQEIEKNEQISQRYMDATDTVGKALYRNSIIKKDKLIETRFELEEQIKEEKSEHEKREQELKAEYVPRLSELEAQIEEQKALYEEAKLLQDEEKSPVTLLDQEIKRMTKILAEKKDLLGEKEGHLKAALMFFKRDAHKNAVMKAKDSAEFVHVSKNVIAMVKFRGSSKQKTPIVLKRYRAIIGDQTIQGDWLVATVLR